ncbi:hypothetical protein Pedsa_1226 [Pseudopedobacter saltans DSM 12145]|uniref:DUF2721 domain-containing protein n=1 Tax=Pseudopedobacter saltans (strain ATCC 51119 / DSM 12145 / JCM 21818 / CCUG 39354 / LMG 10337 / NBRC 100064 / NCIMB 13643) TaxID=762903 RepID=F0SD37_PSESL|nr:DUF2721 domain-containing protein [Pseudopedobacter saltans]ADY51794.1 hypothetical protein Pedsa_1226 [Pseudopedobacter saltans DSM 12145]
MELTTPALLFSAISLLLLAYTNRFLALANLIRSIKPLYLQNKEESLLAQLENLKRRIFLIRNMQGFGILSFFSCVLCMFLLYHDMKEAAEYVFGASLLLLMISLFLSFREIQISANALMIDLMDLEDATEK